MEKDNRSSVRVANSDIVKRAYFLFKKLPAKENELLDFTVEDVSHNGLRGSLGKNTDYIIEKGLKLQIGIVFNNDRTLNLLARIVWHNTKEDCIEFGMHFIGSLY